MSFRYLFKKTYISKEDKKTILKHLKLCMPEYLDDYPDDKIYISECDEEIFMHLTDLLDGKIYKYGESPWTNGKSVIYDDRIEKELQKIIKNNVSNEVTNYCISMLDVLNIIKKYSIKEVKNESNRS